MKDDRALLAGALGTFHVVLLTLLLVVGLYQTIDLGKALADLSTAAGLGIFVVLWAISVYCTNRALRDAGVEPGASMRTGTIVRTGIGWGFWNGMIFFWFLLIAGVVVLLVKSISESDGDVNGIIVFGVLGFGVGTILSAAVGAVLGLVFSLLDAGLLAVTHRLVPPAS